jgi:DNA-directed RNA polymerase specialized sigma24 family protein
MRWAVVRGVVERGEGPATERGGEAYVAARGLIDLARRQRDGLLMITGTQPADTLLGELAPVLAELLGGLSTRQRTVARLALLDGLRQAEVADRLEVSRATVSVTYGRAGVRSIERMAAAVRLIFAQAGASGVAPVAPS